MNAYDVAELAQTLFEEAGDALFLFDPDSEQVLDANPMAQRLSGYARQQLLRLKITYLFRSEIQGGLMRLQEAFRKTGSFHSQDGFLLRHRDDGRWLPVNLTITRLHTEPETLGLITARDMREQREGQLLLKKKEAELRRVLASVSDCLWSATVDLKDHWHLTFCSPVIETISGRPDTYFLTAHERWYAIIHPEDIERVKHVDRLLRTQLAHEEDYRIVRPDGVVRWVRESVQAQPEANNLLRVDGVLTDITERKLAREALRYSQRLIQEQFLQLQSFFNNTPIALGLLDDQLRYVIVNERLAELNGHSVADHLGRSIREIIVPEILALAEPLLQAVLTTGQPVLNREFCAPVPHNPSEMRDWLVSYYPSYSTDGTCSGVYAVLIDNTERKRAEEKLRQSEKQYRDLVETSNDLIWAVDAVGRWTFVNRQAANAIYGCEPEEMLGKPFTAYMTRQQVTRDLRAFATIKAGHPCFHYETVHVRKDGTSVDLSVNAIVLRDEQGKVIGSTGTATDITRWKQAEQAVRKSEQLYRCLIENLEQSIFLKDMDLRFIAVNRHFCDALGCSEAEILGKTDFEFYPRALAEKYRADDLLVLEGRTLQTEEQNLLRGKLRTVRVIKTPVKDSHGQINSVLGIFWDITDQIALEAQVRQAQKMEAIGQLAGGIAHDFNNLLTVILGNLSYVLGRPKAHLDSALDLLKNAEQASLRAAELTQRLLGFSRRSTLRVQPLNLNQAIDETTRLLRRTIDPRIEVVTVTPAALWHIQADPGMINQVLMNLAINARDAMPQGGHLILEAAHFEPDEEYLRLHLEARTGQFVRLRVRDTGAGMSAEVRQRIFEPFFTTKEVGKGTGLGLAMVFGIVKQHHGWVVCESTPGLGTTFDVFLPRLEGDTAPGQSDFAMPAPVGHETILLVDDENLIRNVATTILQRLGYRTLEAKDGLQALQIYKENPRRIDLVLLDGTMPQLSGRDTLRELIRINQDVRVLFSSGYTTNYHDLAGFRQIVGYIQKPYRAEQLASKVREVLDSANRTK